MALGVNDQSTSIPRIAKAADIQSGENAISRWMTGLDTPNAMIDGCKVSYGMYKVKREMNAPVFVEKPITIGMSD
jgi:hypothetical protein